MFPTAPNKESGATRRASVKLACPIGGRGRAKRVKRARTRSPATQQRRGCFLACGARYTLEMRLRLLYLLCAPWDLTVLCLTPALLALGVRRLRFTDGVCWLDVRAGSLLARRWRYSTTVGHVVLLQPGCAGGVVERHEHVHVRQYEAAVCSVWLGALCWLSSAAYGGAQLSLILLLVFGPWWSYAGGSLAAFLRKQRPYLDNPFERHARAETELAPDALHKSLTLQALDP